MDMNFTISISKLKKKGAVGVNIMFGDNKVHILKGGALGVVNQFLLDFYYYPDVETYIINDVLAEELLGILINTRDNLAEQINNISKERGYDAQGEVIMEKSIQNLQNKSKRYGMALAFETVVV